MPQPHVRFKLGRRIQDRNRASQGAPASRVTALVQGTSQVQINDGSISVVGRDSHTHIHYHGTKVDLESILRAIPNLRKIHQDTLAKATPGTGMWLFESDTFKVWLEPNGDLKIIWGSGIPGAGKTILASLVIDMLEALARNANRQICVAYVYVRYSDHSEMTISSLLEVLVKQTVERHPEFLPVVQQVFAQHVHEGTHPTELQLLGLLQQLTQQVATFYILDALDEAPVGIQLDLVQKLASLDCKLFITSRPLKALEAHFPSAHCFPIVAQDEDLDLHIKQKIAGSVDLQELLATMDISEREEIINSVKRRCGGMFLHASLQLDSLCQCISIQDMRETLDAFPAQIEDAYHQTWNRILGQNPKHVLLAKTVLLWTINAYWSMTVEELRHAVATSLQDHKYEPSRLVPENTLIGACRGLVVVDGESRLVRLVHYTARDTLQNLLYESFPHPHSLLASICMAHLSACGFQNTHISSQEELQQALESDPLLSYAHHAWAFHAQQSLDIAATASQLAKFVADCQAFPQLVYRTSLFDLLGPLHVVAWHNLPLHLAESHTLSSLNVQTKIEEFTPLGLAALQGNRTIAEGLLSLPGILVNRVNRWRISPLMHAALGGYRGTVEMLLARAEIEVNLVDTYGWSALMHSALHGQEETVELLLGQPETEVNLVNVHGSSALISAVSNGHGHTAQLLLSHPETKANLKTNYEGRSALMFAASNGDEATVEALLACVDVNVNEADIYGWTPLISAAFEGHQRIIELFLACADIQVNLATTEGFSALIAAAALGHQGVMGLLLARPEIDINRVDFEGRSALIFAASNSHGAAVALLLARPELEVNRLTIEGTTAIMLAAAKGQEDIVELLLTHPEVEVNMLPNMKWPPLTLAASRGYEGMVRALLAQSKTDVNIVDGIGRSALMYTAKNGYEGIAQLLLARPEININLENPDGWSALHNAASKGHEGIVELLVARPEVDINLVDNEGWTALTRAASEGYEGIVKPLLTHPAIKVNLVTTEGWSALICAASNGLDDIIELLLAHPDTEINLLDEEGWSALMFAAHHGHKAAVKVLLAHPDVEFNAPKPRSSSPLFVACYRAHVEVAEVFLDTPGIDVNVTDEDGDTCIKMAAEYGYEHIVELLLGAPGIDTSIVSTNDGHTAMSVAEAKGHDNIVRLLQEFEAKNGASTPSSASDLGGEQVDNGSSSEDEDSDLYEDALESL